ncbi:related to SRP102 - signal recognition particle receptor, beta chain [Cephalotrichum gorgonifer]|uniref:Signal recognition particle receptor subunit beta n=1 Tax=Cephalotrichum gorgonifer TaxID=2041049 RepID=A0AAE8N315_9PEZI|nr:related to SRP102 - signal recognition particle receptor, beta chain [Cephalotrichum gorgonifer]
MATLKESFLAFLEATLTPSRHVFLLGTLIVIFVPILFHLLIVRTSPYTSPPTILLLGPSGAGKTSLATKLLSGTGGDDDDDGARAASDTHTTQRIHTIELTAPSSSSSRASLEKARSDTASKHTKFLLVDCPGHGKLRPDALARVSPTSLADSKTKGIVFMLDASSLSDTDSLSAAATYLYDVLLALQRRTTGTKSSKAPVAIPVLVAPNKADLFTALPAAMVRSSLESEISRVRVSRSKGLLDSGVGIDEVGSEELDGWLGSYGTEKFSFEQMREFDVYVDVLGGNVVGKWPGVDKWWKWMTDKI